jgi:hypothetical protein
MHRHLVRVAACPAPLRPAKVVVLEARREARRERIRPEPPAPRAA